MTYLSVWETQSKLYHSGIECPSLETPLLSAYYKVQTGTKLKTLIGENKYNSASANHHNNKKG